MAKKVSKNGGTCSALGCTMRRGTNLLSAIQMFKFPKDPHRRTEWTNAIKRKDWKPSDYSLLCSKHFIEGKPSLNPDHPDYIPSVFEFSKMDGQKKVERFERNKKRKLFDEQQTSSDIDANNNSFCDERTTEIETQTDAIAQLEAFVQTDKDDAEELQQENFTLKKRIAELEAENSLMRKSLTHVPVYDTIMTKSNKTFKFYTGLENVVVFKCLLAYLLSAWKPQHKSLQPCEEFLLVLMKLRLGLLNLDLATRFNISVSSVSKIFHSWLDVMMINLQRFIFYPSMRTICKRMPKCFKDVSLDNVSCIIDCTEIFIEKPKNLNARAQTYSNYKNHNTMKFLVAILPSGSICFVSKAWGGRVSDKHITQHSGFLDILRLDDLVLADRGFRIDEMIKARGAKLQVPAFTKGKAQLSQHEVVISRKLSKVRVHIERAIRKIKTFRILEGTLPISMVKKNEKGELSTVDKILPIVCSLVNIGNPIIKVDV